jgi:FixJ family two-component response regulator
MERVIRPFCNPEDVKMQQHSVSTGEIFVVDDDLSIREALAMVFTLEGYHVTGFGEGASLLAKAQSTTPSCILLDVQMPGLSGLEILRRLNAHHYAAPIFIISGQADIRMAVEAIRHGAYDLIEKPFDAIDVLLRVREAVQAWLRRAENGLADHLPRHFPGHDLLTPREREVLGQIASGASNKETGRKLGISPRTIEVHRARIMEKLGAKNAADLVRIVLSEARVYSN